MRDGDARVRGGRDPRRHPGHDLELHPGFGERQRLLAAASEHQRVTALQPHDTLPIATELHEEVVDRLLPRRLAAAAAFADVVHLDAGIVGPRGFDDLRVGQRIGGDRVARCQQLLRADSEQAGVARPRADEVDDAAHAPAGRFDAARAGESSRASRSRSRRSRTLRLSAYAPYTSAASTYAAVAKPALSGVMQRAPAPGSRRGRAASRCDSAPAAARRTEEGTRRRRRRTLPASRRASTGRWASGGSAWGAACGRDTR